MNTFKNTLCFICVLLLSACQTYDVVHEEVSDMTSGAVNLPPVGLEASEALLNSPCPSVEIVDDLSSLSDFISPKKQTKSNLVSRVDLVSAESTCKLASKSAIVDLKLVFNGSLGNKGRKNSSDKPFFSYPFFVAVASPSGKILAKEIFAASMTFGAQETTHSYFEKLRQIIPINSKDNAHRYRVLIGFQVTPDQLSYNRTNMVPVK